jgi:hypothetical protein
MNCLHFIEIFANRYQISELFYLPREPPLEREPPPPPPDDLLGALEPDDLLGAL